MNEALPGNATILLLASDPLMRTIVHETLERAGYLVIDAGDVGAAVDRLKEMRPDLLLIRPYISSMPGHMAAQYLRTRCPGLPVLMVGGFLDDDRVRVEVAIDDFQIFPKPYSADELLSKVRDVLRIIHQKRAGA
jgi:DNA-binding response OmpR family regulator